jgi:hypothetical protein
MLDEPAQEAEFKRLNRVKRRARRDTPLIAEPLVAFFKHSVQKRQAKFGQIGECWARLIPETFQEHTSLESFARGTLSVLVDSSSHLYELKQLLLAGLQDQLLLACKSAGLRKITLKPGRWYDGDEPRDRKIRFD